MANDPEHVSQMPEEMNKNVSSSTTYDLSTKSTSTPQNLYRMKQNTKQIRGSPSKIEFKLHRSKPKRFYTSKRRMMLSASNRNKCKDKKSCSCRKEDHLADVKSKRNTSRSFFTRMFTPFSPVKRARLSEDSKATTDDVILDAVEKVDIYYFDHGNSAYFRTTDCPPNIFADTIAQQATYYATRFWAEIFGTIHIGVTFIIALVLQAYRFTLYSIIRPIIVGFFQMTSDYLVKPIITIIFNGLLQPILIFLFNIFASIRDMLEPVADTLDNFAKPIARILRAIRLISFIKQNDPRDTTKCSV